MPTEWGGLHSLGSSDDIVTLEVNNVLVQKRINNVFGLIKGFVDPGRKEGWISVLRDGCVSIVCVR